MAQLKRLLFGCVILFVLLELYQVSTESTFFTSYLSNLVFHHNFHEVVPHRLYRSAEMSSGDLADVIRESGIKTVIDLRLGGDKPQSGELSEEQTARQNGAVYMHVPLKGSRVPAKEKVIELLDALESAQPPVLVHCSSGTHRSGVASALWLMDREGKSFDEARNQLSAEYGYFELERRLKSVISGTETIDYLLWNYAAERTSEQESFRAWVERGMHSHGSEQLGDSPTCDLLSREEKVGVCVSPKP